MLNLNFKSLFLVFVGGVASLPVAAGEAINYEIQPNKSKRLYISTTSDNLPTLKICSVNGDEVVVDIATGVSLWQNNSLQVGETFTFIINASECELVRSQFVSAKNRNDALIKVSISIVD